MNIEHSTLNIQHSTFNSEKTEIYHKDTEGTKESILSFREEGCGKEGGLALRQSKLIFKVFFVNFGLLLVI